MKVLVADDERITRLMLVTLLREWGYDPIEAADGAEALAIMQSEDSPSLVILDWIMPEIDGVDVCRRIRQEDESHRHYIILLTMMKTCQSDIVQGLEGGADDFMVKPFNPNELRARTNVGRRIIELQADLAHHVVELEKALSEVKQLSGLLPTCSNCRKVRDDQGYWSQLDAYMSSHSDVRFTHGLCPECCKELYDGLDIEQLEREDDGKKNAARD